MESNFENAQTKPTLETVLERINLLGNNLSGQIEQLRSEFGSMRAAVSSLKFDLDLVKTDLGSFRNEFQLFRNELEIRIDRIEGMTNKTRSEMLELRADFREWKQQIS